jgi:SAM-dependent methyltransferase
VYSGPKAVFARNTQYVYAGAEVALFKNATRWKHYWCDQIRGYIRGDVLEVGAGLGANTQLLCGIPHRSWTCLEPDPQLAAQIAGKVKNPIRTITGTTADVTDAFDSILYIDVLEHISDDAAEISRAAGLLRAGGHLIVLAPAHQALYTPFDQAIGHFRRYSGSMLERSAASLQLRKVRLQYLDSVGLIASAANRWLLRQSMPSERQILLWDRGMIPLSRLLDPCAGWLLGKSVLGIWRRS